jgi:hypothetical protein
MFALVEFFENVWSSPRHKKTQETINVLQQDRIGVNQMGLALRANLVL